MEEGKAPQKNKMSPEKFKRVVVALTFGAVLLLVILLGFLTYQISTIIIIKKDTDDLEEQIAYYLQLTDEEREKIEACNLFDYIVQEARKLGYKLPDDFKE